MESITRIDGTTIGVPNPDLLQTLEQHQEIKETMLTEGGEEERCRGGAVAYSPHAHVFEYALGDGTSLYVENASGYDLLDLGPSGIWAYLMTWPHLEEWEGERALLLREYGYDGLSALTVAPDDHGGRCRVWCNPNYYAGTCGAPKPDFVRDDNGAIREFDTRAEAQGYLDEYYEAPSAYEGIRACRVFAHRQYAPDDLTVVVAE